MYIVLLEYHTYTCTYVASLQYITNILDLALYQCVHVPRDMYICTVNVVFINWLLPLNIRSAKYYRYMYRSAHFFYFQFSFYRPQPMNDESFTPSKSLLELSLSVMLWPGAPGPLTLYGTWHASAF